MTIDNRLSSNNHVSVICKKINNQFNDYSSPYDILQCTVNLKSLFIRRLQNFTITLYKTLFFTNYPGYLKDMFNVRSSSYNLRGNHIIDSEKTKKAVREWFNNIIREANNKLAREQKNQQFGKH
ncbi:hypothetical protein pdam_00025839 [Pocillopora damicornis]|uniref:Uncharacterized protein n=1 Tax=Pocillopora damicornis TaxID=46731 RepID=A0A3M6UC12_POCDA|nr:hypothetical protein pdam_00025839 [Pocillopora damicornis]